jgi:hypothetical protein
MLGEAVVVSFTLFIPAIFYAVEENKWRLFKKFKIKFYEAKDPFCLFPFLIF